MFQSEVLFQSASSDLNPGGEEQIAELARTLNDISQRIPDKLNWVLRVDGHTDTLPIRTATFPSNWELSADNSQFEGNVAVRIGRVSV